MLLAQRAGEESRACRGLQDPPELGGTSGGHCQHPDPQGQPELPGGDTMNPPQPLFAGPKKRLQKLSCKAAVWQPPRRGPRMLLPPGHLHPFLCLLLAAGGKKKSSSKRFESLIQSLGDFFGDDLPIESGWGAQRAASPGERGRGARGCQGVLFALLQARRGGPAPSPWGHRTPCPWPPPSPKPSTRTSKGPTPTSRCRPPGSGCPWGGFGVGTGRGCWRGFVRDGEGDRR